jgi:hypothetical protein
LFLVALATLMFEILLTRIFSVAMWYHFAFMAVSVAMFGMSVGANLVYLQPKRFPAEATPGAMARYSLYFGVSMAVCFFIFLQIHFGEPKTLHGMFSLAATYIVVAIPFVFGGVVTCLALTRFPHQTGRLYAADLAGAALGCMLVILVVRTVGGPTAVVVAAAIACWGGLCFSLQPEGRRVLRAAVCCTALVTFVALVHPLLVEQGFPLFRLTWVKGALEDPPPLYERWNSFSRVTVHGTPEDATPPFGWGLSPTLPPGILVRQAYIAIDGGAGTVLTDFFDHNCDNVSYLKYDVTNLVHYIRPNSDELVIGAGGGRDILSALCFHQKSVLGVEINSSILLTLNGTYGDFTGHLNHFDNVHFVPDEARSYIVRSKEKSDIVQISLIDTWAATAAGAFVLTENSLYTVEAWKVLLKHLKPHGVLSVSRWYTGSRPDEVLRMITLARQALQELGIADARSRVVVIRHVVPGSSPDEPNGVGTLLVSIDPFSNADLYTLEDVTRRMKFDVVLSPYVSLDPVFADLISGPNLARTLDSLPADVSAPTDNKPFFFHTLRLRDLWQRDLWRPGAQYTANFGAVLVLGALLAIVTVLTLLCIVLPLALSARRINLREWLPLMAYFGAIGVGFMMIEISQMQRLIVFLGHPTYGLAVVLFSLLLSSGAGSYLSRRFSKTGWQPLLALLAVLILFGAVTPAITHHVDGAVTLVRIAVAVLILGCLGVFMGMAFPLGMERAGDESGALTPWLWGVNGAASVLASVLAVAISLNFGIAAAFWTGFVCYVVALFAYLGAGKIRVLPAV